MEPRAVVRRLKEFGRTRDEGKLDMETRKLIRGNPFAFLIAVAFDRNMPWEKAWRIATEIDRQGCLDPALLASKDETELVGLCVQRRLVCSAGDSPAGVRIRSPVAWIAGRRETEFLKPIDKVSLGEIASHRAVT